MEIKPNPGCPNPLCGKLQAAYEAQYNSEAAVSARAASAAAAAEFAEEEVVHDDNSWGISVVPEEASAGQGVPAQSAPSMGALAEGLEYSMPVRTAQPHECTAVRLRMLPYAGSMASCCAGAYNDTPTYSLLS